MNNDFPTSTSDRPSNDASASSSPNDMEAEVSPPSEDESLRKDRLLRERRLNLLDNLIRSFDIMIYCELSALYYMDTSFFHFFIRAAPQFFYFTPKPHFFPPPPANQPYFSAIFLTNFLCFLVHMFSARPEAGEAMRGYLHGGLMIDFVGVKGPVSKIRLLVYDVLVWGLQIGVLAVILERRGLSGNTARGGVTSETVAESTTENAIVQDHDSEEQGMLRSQRSIIHTSDDIELQPLNTDSRALRDDAEGTESEDNINSPPLTDHPLDIFASGQHIVADIHILQSLKTVWSWRYHVTPLAGASGTAMGSGAGSTSPDAIARQRLTAALRNRVLNG